MCVCVGGGAAHHLLLGRSLPPPSPGASASLGHCGVVAMEMWVRALKGEHPVDLRLALE